MRAAASLAGRVTGPVGDEPFPSQPSPPRPPPLTTFPSPAPDAMMPMLGLEAPVVVVRLPGKRPHARPWSQAEEARLTRVCQNCWPDVNWPSIARELGRDVRDCISQSTLLHLQDLRGEAPVSTPKEPSPSQSQPAQSGEQQQQDRENGTMPTATRSIGKGSEEEASRMASGNVHKRGVNSNSRSSSSSSSSNSSNSSSSNSSSSVTNNLLPSQVAALALQHQFDWVAVGRALKADPWECWKTYEAYSQDKTSPNDDSESAHGLTTISSLADDVAAFLPFASSPSPLRRNPLAPPYNPFNHHQPPVPSSFTAATTAAVATEGEADKGSNNRSNISSPISPPPSVLSPPVGTGGPSFLLHHFPRPNTRPRFPFPPHAPASGTTVTTTTPAASFLRSFSASSFQQPGTSPDGGGRGGGGEGETQPHQPAGLQDSTYSTFSGMGGGGGGGASTFLPGSDSMSLSMLQSAMLDMPSLYLGQSTAFGAGASTFLCGGGSTLFPPGAGGTGAPSAGVDGGGIDDLLPPLPPPTAPPFVSSSPVLQPLPRGLGGPTLAVIPATIMEGSEAGDSSIGTLEQSELKKEK